MAQSEWIVKVAYDEILKETKYDNGQPKSMLIACREDDVQAWIYCDQISYHNREERELHIPGWIAENRGLPYEKIQVAGEMSPPATPRKGCSKKESKRREND